MISGGLQKMGGRQNSLTPDQAKDLAAEGGEGNEKDQGHPAQEQPDPNAGGMMELGDFKFQKGDPVFTLRQWQGL